MVVVMDPDPGMDVVTRMPRVMTATVARALAWVTGVIVAMDRGLVMAGVPGMAAARALAWAIGATGAMVQDRVMDRDRVMVQGAGTVRVLPPGVSPVMTVAARKTVIMDRGPDTDQVPTKAATLAFVGDLDPAPATATIRASE